MTDTQVEKALRAEVLSRLKMLKQADPRPRHWPEGCYGSAVSWLLFVGPSPGGKSHRRKPAALRNPTGGTRLWNVDFDTPYTDRADGWGGKYRENMPALVETLIGIRLKEGAGKLFGFANFDWVPSPKEQAVAVKRMKEGEPDVLKVLRLSRPRVVAATTLLSFRRLIRCLRRDGYDFFIPKRQQVRIRIDPGGASYHRTLDAVRLSGGGRLAGTVVIRLPQHPARMLYGGHGHRCARAVRQALIQVYRGDEDLIIDEM